MDAQYKFLRIVCKLSQGKNWVTYQQVAAQWKHCPTKDVLANLANHTYVDIDWRSDAPAYFPTPEAFSYVRQCRDSVRNLVITAATLLVTVWTLLTTIKPLG